jgi:hypothetical protein
MGTQTGLDNNTKPRRQQTPCRSPGQRQPGGFPGGGRISRLKKRKGSSERGSPKGTAALEPAWKGLERQVKGTGPEQGQVVTAESRGEAEKCPLTIGEWERAGMDRPSTLGAAGELSGDTTCSKPSRRKVRG